MRGTSVKIKLDVNVPPPILPHLILYKSHSCSILLVDQGCCQKAQQNFECYSKVVLTFCKMSAMRLY